MSIIWTPLSLDAATKAYVELLTIIVVMPRGLLSVVNPPTPSTMAATGVGADGVVMLIIWTPLSREPVTRA